MTRVGRLVVLTGAGLSTESGIPDFRSPGGVWERFDAGAFHISRFQADPDGFWQDRAQLIAAMDYLDAEPNEAHRLLAQAAQDGVLAMLVTQNVDGLHAKAGTPADRLLEVHGNGSRCVCMKCFSRVPVKQVLPALTRHAPRCRCGGVLKPDVVLFGEPVHLLPAAQAAVSQASELLVAGTSLQVFPVAGLVDLALQDGIPVHIVNRDPTPYDTVAASVWRGPMAEGIARRLQATREAP